MPAQPVSRVRNVMMFALVFCAGLAVTAAVADTLNAVSSSRGGQLGQLFALNDERQRMPDYYASLVPPQLAFASIYLHHYPESLADDGFVEAYTRLFYAEEFAQVQRSPEYRTSPFKRRSIIEGWRTRLADRETKESLTLNVFLPVMLNTNAYDFEAQTFPMAFALQEESPISSGVPGFACLKLDRTLDLNAYDVPESEVKSFLAKNRNSRIPGRGASIFVAVQLRITGKPGTKGAARPRCQLAAQVLSIDAVEYLGSDDYSTTYAVPGAVMTAYYSRAAAANTATAVQIPYDQREPSADAPVEARAFNLQTRKGLIVMPPAGTAPSWFVARDKILDALMDYGDFLTLGVYPSAFDGAAAARCMTQTYLTAEDDQRYFSDKTRRAAWRGATEFEQRRTDAAFKKDALPKLQARRVQTPQRFLILGDVTLPEYDFEQGGFWLNSLNATATVDTFFGHCFKRLQILPMADQLHQFWSIAPADAEAVLNGVPVSHTVGTRKIRTAYMATEVELVNLKSAQARRRDGSLAGQPPLRLKILSARLYADKELTREIFSPPIIRAAPSVLEAGMPDSIAYSRTYRIDYGGEGDYLRLLKARGDFEEWEWPQLLAQQQSRDARYYSFMKPNYRPQTMSADTVYAQDEQYTPFFPHGIEGRNSGLEAHTMTPEQMALFIAWAKRQAAALP